MIAISRSCRSQPCVTLVGPERPRRTDAREQRPRPLPRIDLRETSDFVLADLHWETKFHPTEADTLPISQGASAAAPGTGQLSLSWRPGEVATTHSLQNGATLLQDRKNTQSFVHAVLRSLT